MGTSITGAAHHESMPQNPPPLPVQSARLRMGDGERVVFVEEGEPNQYLKLVASGELDEIMLDALSDYIARQKRRLVRAS